MDEGPRKSESDVVIQDIVCATIPQEGGSNPVGEFGIANADEQTRLDRIYGTIEQLTNIAATEHVNNNCDTKNRVKPENANNIVRLITNEFAFYTNTPLSMAEFKALQDRIADLASKQPENLHLILGSFAVRTKDNNVMNVTPYIECGTDPKINFMVKNYAPDGDPVYKERNNGRRTMLENVEVGAPPESIAANKTKDVHVKPIAINGKKCHFSFNNNQVRSTAGNAKYFSCVDICYDHHMAVAKQYLTRDLTLLTAQAEKGKIKEALPVLSSHIVISNSYPVSPSKKLSEVVTHVDPKYSHEECKPTTTKSAQPVKSSFGDTFSVIKTSPLPCSELQQEAHRELVQKHNSHVDATLAEAARSTSSRRWSIRDLLHRDSSSKVEDPKQSLHSSSTLPSSSKNKEYAQQSAAPIPDSLSRKGERASTYQAVESATFDINDVFDSQPPKTLLTAKSISDAEHRRPKEITPQAESSSTSKFSKKH